MSRRQATTSIAVMRACSWLRETQMPIARERMMTPGAIDGNSKQLGAELPELGQHLVVFQLEIGRTLS
jgi:hypothetical protein